MVFNLEINKNLINKILFYFLCEADNEGNLLSNIKAIENEYPKVIIKQLLNAIRFESYEARQRFPRLIQIVELYPEAIELFVEEVTNSANLMKLF